MRPDERKKKEDIIKAEYDSIKLIFYSFIVYLICRLPELGIYLHLLFFYSFNLENISRWQASG